MKLLKKIVYSFPVYIQVLLHKFNHRIQIFRAIIDESIENQIKIFVPKEKLEDKNYINDLIKDIKLCYVKFLAKPYEYFLLGFDKKTSTERKEILTDIIKDIYCCKYAHISNFNKLSDKFSFYECMKPYFKRDACIIRNNKDLDAFISFTLKHNKFIAKPNKGSFGKSTNIYTIDNNAESIFNLLIKNKTQWIIEELIIQVPEMAQFNSSSVNSIRIPTFRTSKGIKIFGAFMRTGRKGSVVDNAGIGGIFVKIDDQTGKVVSNGFNESNECYEYHPDSNIKFKGFQIPKWNELVSLSIECHSKLPNHKYIGWDFALTNKGWVLMEGNWGQFLCQQVSSQRPMKKEFVSLIKG